MLLHGNMIAITAQPSSHTHLMLIPMDFFGQIWGSFLVFVRIFILCLNVMKEKVIENYCMYEKKS